MISAPPASPRVALIRSPLLGQAREVYAPEGASLAQMAEAATPDAFLRRYLVARVDGTDVPVEAWATTRPSAGQLVQFIVRAGSGDFFRTILQIAIVAAAVWVSGGGLAGVFGSAFAAGSIGAALASAGVAIAGNLILNTLIPLEVPGQNSQKPSPFFTVTGARNSARLYQPAPLVLGKHRVFPPLWGQPIQETVGDDVYLRIPYCFGPAPMQISDVKIGETPLSSYAGVELETRLVHSDPAHLLYAGDPDQDAVGAAITTTFQSRTSASDVDELEVVIGFANGLGGVDSKGRKVSKSVTFEVEYRVAGSGGAWTSVRPDAVQASAAAAAAGEPDRRVFFDLYSFAAWELQAAAQAGVTTGPFSVTRADAGKGFQHRVRWAVPRAADGYDVQLRRTTTESADSNTVDAAVWAILGSRKSFVDPFPNRKLASGVLRVKATDQLNGVIDTFNFIAEPLVPVFSSGALADPTSATSASLEAPAASRNPAHLILNVYRGPQNARPRSDAKINWPSFARFAKFCADNGLHFDEVVDGALTRAELARRIAQAGYGRLHKWGGKLAIVIDRLRTGELPAQVFTPRNIVNLRWRKSFPAEVHAVQIAFANAANGYQADEVTLYLDGYDAANATKFERLQVPGKTDADEVRIVGRQYINNSLRQLEQFTFDMDAEALTCTPGAYTLLQHDVLGTGLGAQRVKSLVMDGADVAGFVLDYPIATSAGPSLACRWRHLEEDGGEAWFEAKDEVAIARDADDPRLFMFAAPRDAAEAPVVGDVVLVGEVERVALEVLVRDIAPDVGFRASITAIPYAPERFTPDGDPLPAHDPKVTLPIGARPATPVHLSTKAGSREIAVSFIQPASPRGVTVTGFDLAVREHGEDDDAWTPVGQLAADERVAIVPAGDPEASYDVFVMAFGRDSGGITVYSDPLIVADVAAVGAPPAPAGCSAAFATRTSSGGASQLVLTANWTPVEDPDVLDTRVEMRVSTGPDVWAEIAQARAIVGKTEIHGLQVGRAYTLGFVHLSRRGIASARITIAEINAPDTLVATGAMTAVPGSPLDVDLAAVITAAAAAAASAAAAAAAKIDAEAAETVALAQAAIATAQAGAATTSAAGAAGSEAAASTHAGTASTQAGLAAASAITAGTHASSAGGSASTATTQASAATAAASAASASAALAANYSANATFARNFTEGLWFSDEQAAITIVPYGASYFATSSDNYPVFRTVADSEVTVAPAARIHPIPGRTYIARWRMRKVTAASDGAQSSHYPYFVVRRVDNSVDYLRDTVTGPSMDGNTWVVGTWYTIDVPWTVPNTGVAISWARPRFHCNHGNGGPTANAVYEFGGFDFIDSTDTIATNAVVASNGATLATAVGSLATLTNTVAANFQQATSGSVVDNSTFQAPLVSAIPTGWANWAGSGGTQVARVGSTGLAYRVVGGAAAAAGFNQLTPHQSVWAGQWLMRSTIRRTGGSLTGAGVYVQVHNASGVHFADIFLDFSTEAMLSGAISSTPDGVVSWEKLVTLPAGASRVLIFAMTHWQGGSFGSVATANQIDWHEVDFVPIGNAHVRLTTAEATIVTHTNAIATNAGAFSTLTTTVTANHTALRAANDGAYLPSTFEHDDLYWTQVGGSFVNVSTIGRVYQVADAAHSVRSRGRLQLRPNRVYRLSARFRVLTDSTNGHNPVPLAGLTLWDATGANLAGIWTTVFATKTAADGWVTVTGDYTTAAIVGVSAGATQIDSFAQPNWHATNNPNAVSQLQFLKLEDVTDIVTANASIATVAAAAATAASSVATLETKLTARIGGSEGAGLTKNPRFLEEFTGAGIPPGWAEWISGSGTCVTRIGATGKAFRLVGGAGADNGIQQELPGGSLKAGPYIYRVKLRRVSGTLDGVGIYINWTNASNANIGAIHRPLADFKNTAGETTNAPDGITTWDIPVTAPAGVDKCTLYLMAHWSANTGGTSVANSIDFFEADLIPLGFAEATVNEVKTAVADGSGAYSYYGLKVGAGNRFASIEALASTKTNVSALRFTADKFQIYNNSTDVAIFDVTGTQIRMLADLNVSAGITVGSARLKVALESIRKTGVDGAAITWAGGTNIGNVPEYVLDLSTLAPLSTGEQYSVYLTGVTATGATVYAKIITPGTTATVTQSTDTAGGGGNPTRVMAKTDSADAYDGVYNFRVTGTISVVGFYDGELGAYINVGAIQISTWFNDGGGWDEGPPIYLEYSTIGSDQTGNQAFDATVPVSWANPIGAGSTYDFGITADYGGVVSDLHTVSYTKQTSSGTRTASPAGETVKITAFPRNA
jgi:hypothetical protein